MVLGKLPVPGRPTNLDYSRARVVWSVLLSSILLSSVSLFLGDGPI